jgi:hypothetical protein
VFVIGAGIFNGLSTFRPSALFASFDVNSGHTPIGLTSCESSLLDHFTGLEFFTSHVRTALAPGASNIVSQFSQKLTRLWSFVI